MAGPDPAVYDTATATFLSRMKGSGTSQTRPEGGVTAPPLGPARPVGQWGFTGVAVTSLGGPLALAALYAPSIAAGASSSAGLAMVAAAVAFGFPLAIWLGYARHVSSSRGLYSSTEAAAGRRVALVQAGLWALSYLLYIVYTMAQIVYDTLPAVLPSEPRYQTLLEIVIPVVLAGVMIADRRTALLVIGLLAAGQLALAAAAGAHDGSGRHDSGRELRGVRAGRIAGHRERPDCAALHLRQLAVVHGRRAGRRPAPGVPHRAARRARRLPRDRRRHHRRRRATGRDPALMHAPILGMAVAQKFVGHGFAAAVGIGVAVSVAGVILVSTSR